MARSPADGGRFGGDDGDRRRAPVALPWRPPRRFPPLGTTWLGTNERLTSMEEVLLEPVAASIADVALSCRWEQRGEGSDPWGRRRVGSMSSIERRERTRICVSP